VKDREAIYRLRLAEGFLEEARQDVVLQRWRSALDNSQLAVEHAVKSVLALLGPVVRQDRCFISKMTWDRV
jgi:HEPN domain-containing protein